MAGPAQKAFLHIPHLYKNSKEQGVIPRLSNLAVSSLSLEINHDYLFQIR